MTRIVEAARVYRSELREQQAEETRERILNAVVRVMARGVAELSIPAVAREAGVSVPTVYRRFGSKRQLLAELQPHFARSVGIDKMREPRSLPEVEEAVRTLFTRMDQLGDLVFAALASPAAQEARQMRMPERVRTLRAVVDTIAPELSTEARDRLTRVMVILTSSGALRTWRDHLGRRPDEAADDVAWVLRAVVGGASATSP